ncbi:MAG: phenylalanine--tRNA ligase subunit alpha, partial [Anaerolineae bacterium]|nr:phenylalanine--tRNA ligase subunit alpha [Anaerolineae bacterium]
MSQPIAEVEQEALAALDSAKDAESLQQWKSKYLGNKGAVRALLSQIGGLPTEERAGFGQGVNALKDRLTELFEDRENALKAQAIANDLEEGQIDITLPGRSRQVGGLHPVTMMHRQFHKIWADMGFQVFRSREVEEDDINFTMLNMPPHHPARDMQDTFYTDQDGVILRTHTSP